MTPIVGIFMLGGTLLGAIGLDQRKRAKGPGPAAGGTEESLDDLVGSVLQGSEPSEALLSLAEDLRAAQRMDLAVRLEAEGQARRKAETARAEVSRFVEAVKAAGSTAEIDPGHVTALRRVLGLADGERYDTAAAMAAQAIVPEAPAGDPIVPDGREPLGWFEELCSAPESRAAEAR